MILIDAIRGARSGHAILFLLTAYLEDRQFSGRLPAHLTALPLAGIRDVTLRLEKLAAAMEISIRLLDLSAIDAVAEAVRLFGAAVKRLAELSGDEIGGGSCVQRDGCCVRDAAESDGNRSVNCLYFNLS